jgi:hypothetical protein
MCILAHINYSLVHTNPSVCSPIFLRHAFVNNLSQYRNINLLSIDYGFRPRLRSRLTLGGRTFPRKPLAFGGEDSHLSLATYTCILTSILSSCVLTQPSSHIERSPTIYLVVNPQFRWCVLAPVRFRRMNSRPVSCYALFKWWLLLSQHPGCLRIHTSFPT